MDLEARRTRAGKTWVKLSLRWEKHPGIKINNDMHSLETTRYILNENFRILKRYLETNESDYTLLSQANIPKFRATLREVSRLLHNYICSVLTLIDHTRNFVKKMDHDELTDHYSKNILILTKNPCSHFAKQLRNYVQHRELIIPGDRMRVTRIPGTKNEFEEDQKILLSKEELLGWKKWNKESIAFIESQGEEIHLRNIFVEYQKINNDFITGVIRKAIECFDTELSSLDRLREELITVETLMQEINQKRIEKRKTAL